VKTAVLTGTAAAPKNRTVAAKAKHNLKFPMAPISILLFWPYQPLRF
jgi:hypothetical protein